jgi:hypothetical protein
MTATKARPGFRRVTVIEDGREVTTNVRADALPEPTQDELAAELAGTVALGWKKDTVTLGTRGGRGVVEFEVFVDVNNPRKTWRRYRGGRIERMFSVEPDPAPQALGSVPRRPSEPSMFAPALDAPPEPEESNPFEGLDAATSAAIRAALGLRR